MNSSIQPAPDFAFAPTAFSHGWCQLAPFEYSQKPPIFLSRLHQLSDGTCLQWTVQPTDNHELSVKVDRDLTASQQAEVESVIRRCLSFDDDLSAFYDLLAVNPRYNWIGAVGAGRMLVGPSVWEDLAKTLLTTNTTWAMTRQMVARLVTLGTPYEQGHVFPTPQQVAALSADELNAHVRAGYRGAYLHQLATEIASGKLNVEVWHSSDMLTSELYRALRQLKGFGDYAAGSMLRLLGRHDYLGIDSVCRDMYRKTFNNNEPAPDAAIHAHYEPYGSWRGLVMWMDVMAENLSQK